MSESAPEPSWERFASFRLPSGSESEPDQHTALKTLQDTLATSLSDPLYEFGFGPSGNLWVRTRVKKSGIGRIYIVPIQVYNQLRTALLSLGIDPAPPEFLPYPPEAEEAKETIAVTRNASRSILARALGLFRTRTGEGAVDAEPVPASIPEPRPYLPWVLDPQTEIQHALAQFASLQEWLEHSWAEGHFQDALLRWYRRRQEAEQPHPVERMLIPAGEQLEFYADGVPVRVLVHEQAKSAKLEVPDVGNGVMMTVTLPAPSTVFAVGDRWAELRGVVLHLRQKGLLVTAESRPDAARLTCAPAGTRNCQVVWREDSPARSGDETA